MITDILEEHAAAALYTYYRCTMFLLYCDTQLLDCSVMRNPDNHNVPWENLYTSLFLYCGVTDVPADTHGVGELQITEALDAVFGSDGRMVHCPD
jgi:hypothetical protein